MDQIWWNFSLSFKLGTWRRGGSWVHFKVGFQWYYNCLKKFLYPPLHLTFSVKGIVECKCLNSLWWKADDRDRNKTHFTSINWLVSPVDLFTSLNSIQRSPCLSWWYREVGREDEEWKHLKNIINFFTWGSKPILKSGLPGLFYLSGSSTHT